MANVDHLGWVAEKVFAVHGARLGLRSNCPELLQEVIARYRTAEWLDSQGQAGFISLWKGAPPSGRNKHFHIIYELGKRVARTLDLEEMIEAAGFRIQVRIAVEAKQHFFIQGLVTIDADQKLTFHLPGSPRPEAPYSIFNPHFLCLDEDGLCRPFPQVYQEATPLPLSQVVLSPDSTSRTLARSTGTGLLMRWVINRDGREEAAFRTLVKACRNASFQGP